MNVILDNIIFALQRSGGISVVWQQHLRRLIAEPDVHLRLLAYPNTNVQCGELSLPEDMLVRLPLRHAERFRVPDYQPSDAGTERPIFHSSYFRILPGAKNITTVHDLTYHFFRHGPARWAHLWEEKRAVLNSEAVICVSESTRRDLLKVYPMLDPERVHVVYNGVSEAFFPLQKVDAITPFAPGEYLLYVGNRDYYKNFTVAVEIAAKTHKPLVLVGPPLLSNARRRLDERLGYGRYAVLNFLSESELNTLYNGAHCLLYPSAYEGFGIPPLEAQRAGCPVVAQAVSSLPEVMGHTPMLSAHDDLHRLAQEGAEMVMALGQEQLRRDVIRAGIENAACFNWDATYKNTISIYRNIK